MGTLCRYCEQTNITMKVVYSLLSLLLTLNCLTANLFKDGESYPDGYSECAKKIRRAERYGSKTHFCMIYTSVSTDLYSFKKAPFGYEHRILYVFNSETKTDKSYGLRGKTIIKGTWQKPDKYCSRDYIGRNNCYGYDNADYIGSTRRTIDESDIEEILAEQLDDPSYSDRKISWSNCVCFANSLCDYALDGNGWDCHAPSAGVAWNGCYFYKYSDYRSDGNSWSSSSS